MVNIFSPGSGIALGILLGSSTVAAVWRWSVWRRRSLPDVEEPPKAEAVPSEALAATPTAVPPDAVATPPTSALDLVRRNEDYFRLLIQNASDIITVIGSDGSLRYASPAVERLLGWRPDELEGRPALDMVHPDDEAHVRHQVARAVASRDEIVMGKFRFRHRDGAWRMLEGTGRIERDWEG
ncbi:MAG: PAS domain S-box protein, partial [Gemmatimonadaceae bacterium]|nr:PAS domain S-box protein [Gemmatimonadaceae bacterium]